VSDAVTQLDQVTQQNAALVEESAAAADSLSQQAAKLVDAMSMFKLASERGAPNLAPAANKSAMGSTRPDTQHTRPTQRSAPLPPPATPVAAASPVTADATEWETF